MVGLKWTESKQAQCKCLCLQDKFLELQGQHDELSSRLECAVQERQDVLERNTILQVGKTLNPEP